MNNSSKKLKIDNIIKISNKIHNNFYDYSLVDYVNSKTNVKIICPVHGIFNVTIDNHINKKSKCSQCIGNKRYSNKIIIEKFEKIHNNFYDYSLIDYKNRNTNISIICPVHGVFKQLPKHHLNGSGCPKCKESKGDFRKKVEHIASNVYKSKCHLNWPQQ
jgi:hypothetical protein